MITLLAQLTLPPASPKPTVIEATQVVTPQVVVPTVVSPVVISESTATFTHYFTWPVVTMLVVLILAAMMLWNAQKSSNKIDFKDLILDFDVNRVSLSKLGTLIAMIVTSWIMISLTIQNQMTEAYILAFGSMWAGAGLGAQLIKTRDKEVSVKAGVPMSGEGGVLSSGPPESR